MYNTIRTMLAAAGDDNNNSMWIMLGVVGAFMILFLAITFFQKKNRANKEEIFDKLAPGDKITTIGGILATIIEVNLEEQTLLVQTGSDEYPTYLNILKGAIYTCNDVAYLKEEERKRIEAEERAKLEKEGLIAPMDEVEEADIETETSKKGEKK